MKINILTLNVAQQPIRIFTGLKNRNKRAKELVRRIIDLDPQPDIVCLQELFRKKSQKIVIKGLKDIYPHYYIDESPGKYIVGVNSGLAIFSKYPIINTTLYTYDVFRGVENFAKKGIMGIQLQIAEQNVWVFTTHLQAGIGAEPCICKLFDTNTWTSNQLKFYQIQRACQQMQKVDDDSIIIFTGDLNIRSVRDLYTDITQKLNAIDLIDIYNEDESPIDTTVIGKPDRRIDYIWTNNNSEEDESVVTTEFGDVVGLVTDHYGVVGVIDI